MKMHDRIFVLACCFTAVDWCTGGFKWGMAALCVGFMYWMLAGFGSGERFSDIDRRYGGLK